MITNPKVWEKFEKQYQARQKLSYKETLKLFNALYKEAQRLDIFRNRPPLEGLESRVHLAKVLNSLTRS